MSDTAAEFERRVPLIRLGAEPFRQRIEADEDERIALARRFDLISLNRLAADIELVREPAGTILLSATLEAAFVQECIVTFDPVAGAISEEFRLRYGTPEAEAEVPDGDDDPAFEPLEGDSIDVGEAVAQEFSLALPPFPRQPDAVVEDQTDGTRDDESPFASLARLVRREPQ